MMPLRVGAVPQSLARPQPSCSTRLHVARPVVGSAVRVGNGVAVLPVRPRLSSPANRILCSPPTSTAGDSGNGVAATPAALMSVSDLPANIIAQLGTSNPLVQALSSSKSSLLEAQRVREALEAEAQEVAQVRGTGVTPRRGWGGLLRWEGGPACAAPPTVQQTQASNNTLHWGQLQCRDHMGITLLAYLGITCIY